MGTLYRLRAYFGMVPAEEMDYSEYPDYADHTDYRDHRDVPEHAAEGRRAPSFGDPRHDGRSGWRRDERRSDRWSDPDDRYGDYGDYSEYEPAPPVRAAAAVDRFGTEAGRRSSREAARPARDDREPIRAPGGLGAAGGGAGGGSIPPVRGSLAVSPDVAKDPAGREAPMVVERAAERHENAGRAAVPEQRDRGAAALARITTLQPTSFAEARTIGERYRDGVPVIMNLTELDESAARRLVDFAAGLAFALRGSIDKVTSRVFLLTPADVEVSADDARRLAERKLFRQD